MGCDIHVHVEINKTVRNEKQWICADYFTLNPYYAEEGEEKYSLVGFCDERNYGLFATLANVRNYGNTPCICMPKGLPHDACSVTEQDAKRWGDDGHSHSYLTLQELIDFKKDYPKLKIRGMVSPAAQVNLDNYGIPPESWCQATNMNGWDWREWEVENNSLDELIEAMKKRADEFYFIYSFEWKRSYEEAYEKAKDIRIVFWFDN